MRAVLDANVFVSALLSPSGAPAQIVEEWLGGRLEIIVSEALVDEVAATLARPKLRSRVPPDAARELVELLRRVPEYGDDQAVPRVSSRDPGDDYLIALAASAHATLVTGDAHLLELADRIPVVTPREFLERLG